MAYRDRVANLRHGRQPGIENEAGTAHRRTVTVRADAEHAAIDATDPGSGPRLSFQKVPEPKTVKNRLHLDLRTDQFQAESDRLTGLGATAIRSFERPRIRWTTFADPEGNEFDLVAADTPASGAGH
jgi:Glyoxalase-like domain